MIHLKYATEIAKILVEIGGANAEIANENHFFIYYLTKESGQEYRFMGHLGGGGKFRVTYWGWKIDCYSEDSNPKREALIEEINGKLKTLYEEYENSPEFLID